MTPKLILAALLAIFPHMSHGNRQCIIDHQPRLEVQLQEVSQPIEPGAPVPPTEVTATVAFLETHLGCDHGEGGNWGAPIDRNHRHTAGTHMDAVTSLVHGYQECGTWEGAVFRFRTGVCNPAQGAPQTGVIGTDYLHRFRSLLNRMYHYRDTHPEVPALGTE